MVTEALLPRCLVFVEEEDVSVLLRLSKAKQREGTKDKRTCNSRVHHSDFLWARPSGERGLEPYGRHHG